MDVSPFFLIVFHFNTGGMQNIAKKNTVCILSDLLALPLQHEWHQGGVGGYQSGGIAHGLCSRINLLSFQNSPLQENP